METDKLYAAVIGALVAFICTKVYDALSKTRYRYNLHRCLREELVYVLEALQATRNILENKIESKNDLHFGEYPRKIQSPIYQGHYLDICLYLTRSQRASFQQIFVVIEELNEFIEHFFKKKCELNDCERECFAKLTSAYRSLRDVIYMVENHIEYNREPFNQEENEQEMAKIREEVENYICEFRV